MTTQGRGPGEDPGASGGGSPEGEQPGRWEGAGDGADAGAGDGAGDGARDGAGDADRAGAGAGAGDDEGGGDDDDEGGGDAARRGEHPLGDLWDSERPPRRVPADGVPRSGPPDRRSSTTGDGPPDPAAAQRRPRDPVRTTIRGLGQLLITAGVVVLLFVVYEIWVTNLFGQQRQAAATQVLDNLWASESDVVTAPGQAIVTQAGGTVVVTAPGKSSAPPPDRQRHYDTTEGVGFAKMYVPSFGADFVLTVIEGTNEADLYAGPGHYKGTQYPGEPGNFALAGHRVNKGAPFDDLGLLHSCDAIVVETRDDWYVYRVLPMQDEVADWAKAAHPHCDGVGVQTGQYAGVYGRKITSPGDYPVVLPVPGVDNTVVPADAESLITLTTCHPKFSDRERMIIHGILAKTYPKKAGFLPPELQEAD